MHPSPPQQTWAIRAPVKTLIGMLVVGLLVGGFMPTARAGTGDIAQPIHVIQMEDRAESPVLW